MILSSNEIKKAIKSGSIYISDYHESRMNPNSYNLRLHNVLKVYDVDGPLDMKSPLPTKEIIIPEDGLVLEPGTLYLGSTVERTNTYEHIPMLEGRSSIGRLGINIHVTAGFGDVGFDGNWTLEITCVQPVRIYPNIEICQIYYQEVKGEIDKRYNGKYQNSTEALGSLIHKEFE